VAVIDLETLPEGVGLPEGEERLEFHIDQNQTFRMNVQFGARERETTTKLDQLPQLIFQGLQFGLIIAICAVGLSIINGTTGLVNFSHGEHVTWGAVVAWFLNVDHGIHLVFAAPLAIAVGAAPGALIDLVLWRRLRNRGVSLLAMMIVSIGLSLAARNVLQVVFGETTKAYRDFNIQIGHDYGLITVAKKDMWTIGIALFALVAVATVLQYTRIGKATRAVAASSSCC
jgi:neutral amino acid transport system permease protein